MVATKIQQALGRGAPYVDILPVPVLAQRAPASSDILPAGQLWVDKSVSPDVIYTSLGQGVFQANNLTLNTDATFAAASNSTASSSLAIKTYADNLAIAGSPAATETTPGIAEIATQAETDAGLDDARFVTPLKLATYVSSAGVAGSFSTLDASGAVTFNSTGAISMTSDTASLFDVTGAGVDLTLSSDAGRVVVNGEEAAADALRLVSAAGGLDADVALQMNLATSQNAADALVLSASAGGIDILAAGAAGEDIDITNTNGSIRLVAGESAVDAIVLSASIGGVQILAPGAAAGEDIVVTATGSSVKISATENVSDAIVLESTTGGIDILASGAAAGEDIDIIATGSSVNIQSTENAALAVYLHANGGTSETIRLRADQGTGVDSLDLLSDVGGITLTAGLATADAINIVASNAGGGIDIDAGTAGVIVDTTGGISLDSAAASNFTATGAFDLTVSSTAGSLILNAGEAVADALNFDAAAGGLDVNVALQMNLDSAQAAADAVRVIASDAAGGGDFDFGTGGFTLDTTGVLSLDSAGATNLTATGAFDVTVSSTAGSLVLSAGEAAADALNFDAAAGGLDVDVALQMNLASSQNAADAIVINASAGGIDITAAGAAAEDLDLVCTSGSLNLTAGESAADSMVFTNNGMDIVISGAAGRDFDLTNTGGSVNITATEDATDAIVINASGAASALQLDAGTGSVRIGTGLVIPSTAVDNAASPYTVLGTDYFLSVDTSGGAVTVTLPAATALAGRTFVIKDMGGAAAVSNITIGGGGTNLVGGGAAAATKVLSAAYSGATVISNGTTWSYAYVA